MIEDFVMSWSSRRREADTLTSSRRTFAVHRVSRSLILTRCSKIPTMTPKQIKQRCERQRKETPHARIHFEFGTLAQEIGLAQHFSVQSAKKIPSRTPPEMLMNAEESSEG